MEFGGEKKKKKKGRGTGDQVVDLLQKKKDKINHCCHIPISEIQHTPRKKRRICWIYIYEGIVI